MKTLKINKDLNEIPHALQFLDEQLATHRIPKDRMVSSKLAIEELLGLMIENAYDDSKITISVSNILGILKINFKSRGKNFKGEQIFSNLLYDDKSEIWSKEDGELEDEHEVEEINGVLHNMLAKLFANNLSVHNFGDRTLVSVKVNISAYSSIIITLGACMLGILTGMLMRQFFPGSVSGWISGNLFSPIYTMFMNALKMIVAPLVFCSIASSIADFGDIKALGKIAGKVVVMYLITSFIAIGVGLLTYNIFPIGDPALAASVEGAEDIAATASSQTVSIKNTIIDIVPNNIITPFQTSNMMQVIFMAVILGLGAAAVVEREPELKQGLIILNNACSRITTALVGFIPLIVFCAMGKMMINMELRSLSHVVIWVPVIYFGDIIMICVYCLLILILSRLNPFIFIKKFFPAMINAFTLSSSTASLPTTFKQCKELGISSRIYSFSLPLGATINMDGSCISLMITSLFFAKIFGVPVNGGLILTLFIAIMVLSIGAPGVPGGALICMAMLAPEIGVPAEATSLIMGLYPIMAMMQVCTNVTGDAVVTAIVAKKEKALNLEKFNS